MSEKSIPLAGHIQEFIPSISDWSIYKRRLENYYLANNIDKDERKRAILLSLLNETAYKLLFNMCIPDEPESKSYGDIIFLMDEHFKPISSVFCDREKFFEAKKLTSESPKEWAARLRELVAVCKFGGASEIGNALVNQFVIGYEIGQVKTRLYEENESVRFVKVVEIASAKTSVSIETKDWYSDLMDLKYTDLRSSFQKNGEFACSGFAWKHQEAVSGVKWSEHNYPS